MGIFPSCRTFPSVREDPSLPSQQEKFCLFLAALRQSSRREFPGSAQIPDSPALFCLLEVQIFPGKCGNRSRMGQEHFYPLWFLFPGFFLGIGCFCSLFPNSPLLLDWNHPHQDFGMCSIPFIISAHGLIKDPKSWETVMATHSPPGLGCG